MREMIKWPIMQSCMGSKDMGFIAVHEPEGHHTATNISVDTLCRLICTVKRGGRITAGELLKKSMTRTRDVRFEVLDFDYV